MTARPSPWRALPAAVLAAAVVTAGVPLAGVAGWTTTARAADPAAADPAAADPAAIDPAGIDPPPTVIRHGPRTDRVVALTFDDGWSPVTLRQIYRILVRERVPATFFVTGIYVQRAPGLWRRIAASGFPLANHSFLHRDTRDLAPRLVARDLARTREVVEKATGQAMLPYYRPPYGARTEETDRLAAAAGFPYVVLWDTTAADAIAHPTVSGVIRSAITGRSGSIVLLHAGPAVTPRALPAIIASYRARGFRFVTLPELLGTPRAGSPPADPADPAAHPGPDPAAHPGSDAAPDPGTATSGPATSGAPSRAVDRRGEDARPGPTGGPGAMIATGRHAMTPLEAGGAVPATSPVPSTVPPLPARDAAWARRDGTPTTVAAFTVAFLVVLLAGAAVAGRRRRPEETGVQ